MKPIRLFPLLGLFLICLLLGFRAGRHLADSTNGGLKSNQLADRIPTQNYPVPKASRTSQSLSATPVPLNPVQHLQGSSAKPIYFDRPTGNGQLNLLAIGVDRMDVTEPNLESLWLVVFSPDIPHFMFLPIFPDVQTGMQEQAERMRLPANFTVDKHGAPVDSFFTMLESRGIWWDSYLLLDETGLLDLVSLFGTSNPLKQGSANDFQAASGSSQIAPVYEQEMKRFIEAMPSSQEYPVQAQRAQYRLIQEVCLRSTSYSPVEITRSVFQLIKSSPEHIRTNLHQDQVLTLWGDNQESHLGFSCEFPSLKSVSIH